MKREPRGFSYPLEPLRLKCDWEMQEVQIKLAEMNRKIAGLEREASHFEALLIDATTELAQQRGNAQVIYADKQRLAQSYIEHQAQLVTRVRKQMDELNAERHTATKVLHRLRKFADGLDENRLDDIKGYSKILEQASNAETDDAWLRIAIWKEKQ